MASGGTLYATGSILGTGVAIAVTKVGFQPKSVMLYNTGGDCTGTWHAGMADASLMKAVDSGSGATDISTVTSNGVTPSATGFTLGTDTDLNVSAQRVRYVCLG